MPEKQRNILSKLIKILVPIFILSIGLGMFLYFKASKPHITRGKPRQKPSTTVKVITAQKVKATPTIKAMGTVKPSREIKLRPRVSGEIVQVSESFVPGGVIRKGEEILQIDQRDYEIALKKKKSALVKAKADLALEKGNQEAAKEELKMFQETISQKVKDDSLALRQPQLKKAKAEVENAQADLEQARLDLSRTSIKAPFNALILKRQVNLGSEVSQGEDLATLIGTDTYWIEVSCPIDRLSLLRLGPKKGSPAKVLSQTGGEEWTGRAIRITGQVKETALMGVVTVAVKDPLALTKTKINRDRLLIGDYVQVQFQGSQVNDVFKLPRKALREAGTVWLAENGTLKITQASWAWKAPQSVYINSGLQEGDQVIISDIATPVNGMALKAINSSRNSTSSNNPLAGNRARDNR